MTTAAAFRFAMPKPVRITGRSSSITNSFVNGIIPVVPPTPEQVDEALRILGMETSVVCAYCGDTATEWDHLRPLVVDKQPTGYVSEIHNLVPACGKCNQSKGNKPWRAWMFSSARLSPATRGRTGLEERAARLSEYELWQPPTRLDFEEVVGEELWAKHWRNHAAIIAAMRDAEATVELIRARVASAGTAPQRVDHRPSASSTRSTSSAPG
ncbi:HNH endonuclease [Agromyces sp. PvR057]|uniref:HNH endonuclease signature motif containing protein n=1 Tax=Agromyces sp. PvR057 TaxID=3156403 RepID=UPI0033944728